MGYVGCTCLPAAGVGADWGVHICSRVGRVLAVGTQGTLGGCGSFLLPLKQHLTRLGAGCSSRQDRSLSLLHHDGTQFRFWLAFALQCCHQQCPSATQGKLRSRELCSCGFKVGKRQAMPFQGRSSLQNLPTL